MKKIILSFLLTVGAVYVFAQDRTITGVVNDVANEPVIGATIRVPGTSLGTITDVDGSFSIDVPSTADQLSVSYLGLEEPLLVDITSDNLTINIGDTSVGLEDVIVTGYSQIERSRFTGSVKTVGEKPLEDKNTSDISNALAGEVAGLNVIQTNGQPGSSAQVRIRGFSSANGNRAPLYVVDGAIFNGDLSSINPNDIESTTVLKDASATAIYGARGANGVIVVTTKKGKAGDSKIDIDVKQGFNYRGLPYYDVVQSPEEYIEIGWEGLENAFGVAGANQSLFDDNNGIAPYYNIWDTDGEHLIDPATGKFYPNINRKYTPARRRDEFFNRSDRTEANFALSGGEGKTTYRTSFGILDEEGYFLASDFRRYSAVLNLQHQVKPWLKGGVNFNYANQNSNFSGQNSASSVNGFYLERNAPPIYGLYLRDSQGNRYEDPIYGGYIYDYGDEQSVNDLGQANNRNFSTSSNIAGVNEYDTDVSNNNNIIATGDLTASFLKNFDFKVQANFQNWNNRSDFLQNPFYGSAARGASGVGGTLGKQQSEVTSLNMLQLLTYGKEIGDHEFTINAAHESNEYDDHTRFASGIGLSDPNSLEFNNIIDHNPNSSSSRDFNIESYFAFGDYSFKDKYFLNANIRRDGSSRFAEGNRWGTFGSVGLGWEATREDFMRNVDWVDFLKLRSSFGVIGDQGNFTTTSIYQGQGNLNTIASFGGNYAILFSRPVDGDITWERQNKIDFGLDADILDNRLSVTLDYYVNNTKELFFDQRRGPSSGRPVTTVNSGELQNKGFEFDVAGRVIDKNGFTLDLTVLGETFTNTLTEAPLDSSGDKVDLGLNGVFAYQEGKSIFDYYVREFVGVDSATGLSQWTQYYDDMNSNGVVDAGETILDLEDYRANNENINLLSTSTTDRNSATLHYTGESVIPDLRGATRLAVGFKGINLESQLLYSIGGYALDGNYQALMDNTNLGDNNWHADMRNRWQNPGDETDIPALTNGTGTPAGQQNGTSTRFITKADYLILNNVRLSYDVPERLFNKIGIQGAKIWFSGDNLWAKTERDGFFPFINETGSPIREQYDPLSTVTSGISFNF